jgi:hypothetical protein
MAGATGTIPAVLNFISHFTIFFLNSSSVEVNINRYEILITVRQRLIGNLTRISSSALKTQNLYGVKKESPLLTISSL